MNEKFGVELQLIVDKYNSKINEIKAKAENFSKTLKEKLKIKPEIDSVSLIQKINNIKQNFEELNKEEKMEISLELGNENINKTKQEIEELENEIISANDIINYSLQHPAWSSWNNDKIIEAESNLKICEAKVNELSNSLEKLKNKSEEANGNISKIKGSNILNLSKSVDRATSRIKRMALSLLSLRSIYALLSRASSSYLSTDEERANKLQSVWVGMGAMLTPIIDVLTNAFMKLVGYINVFVTALTGTNYIAKASTNYLNSLSKSAKATAKSLAGFDEINNIGTLNSDNSVDSNPFSSLNNVELNDGLVKKLENLAYWLKENWHWIKVVGEILLITFGVTQIAKIISNLSGLTTALGSKGLLGTLNSIATFGAIAITIYFVGNTLKEAKELSNWQKEFTKKASESQKKWLESETDLNNIYITMKANSSSALELVKQASAPWNKVLGLSDGCLETAKQTVINLGEQLKKVNEIRNSTELTNDEKAEMLENLYTESNILDELIKKLEIQGVDVSELENISSDYNQTLKEIADELLEQGLTYDDIYEKTGLTKENLNDIYGICKKPTKISIEADTKPAKKSLTDFVKKIGSSIWASLFPKISFNNVISRLASLDVGTNYVPQDQLAIIHKGEAVIPKKFNSKEYFNTDNDRVISKLDDLIYTLENKDMNAYISRDTIGQASRDYISSKSRALGKSVI